MDLSLDGLAVALGRLQLEVLGLRGENARLRRELEAERERCRLTQETLAKLREERGGVGPANT